MQWLWMGGSNGCTKSVVANVWQQQIKKLAAEAIVALSMKPYIGDKLQYAPIFCAKARKFRCKIKKNQVLPSFYLFLEQKNGGCFHIHNKVNEFFLFWGLGSVVNKTKYMTLNTNTRNSHLLHYWQIVKLSYIWIDASSNYW